ncbi:MAG: hypothetical protein QXO98_04630 [Sulfolobales archaeon]
MPSSTTIYSSRGLDAVFATAALASTLYKKGYRVFVEFPKPSDIGRINIVNSYSIDITHLNNVAIKNAIAITHVPLKRLGLVYKYDNDGKYNTTMKLNNINSTLEVALEYIRTLNDSIFIPQELLKDLSYIKFKELTRLTRVGRTIYYAYRWGLGRDETLLSLYNYAYLLFTTKNVKITSEIEKDAKNYEQALSLINTIINEGIYEKVGDSAIIVISNKYDGNELLKNNIHYLRVVANELLGNLCKNHKMAVMVFENYSGHEVRLCINKNLNLDVDKVLNNLPNDLSDVIEVKSAKTYAYITFKNPENGTLDNSLKVSQAILSCAGVFFKQSQ